MGFAYWLSPISPPLRSLLSNISKSSTSQHELNRRLRRAAAAPKAAAGRRGPTARSERFGAAERAREPVTVASWRESSIGPAGVGLSLARPQPRIFLHDNHIFPFRGVPEMPNEMLAPSCQGIIRGQCLCRVGENPKRILPRCRNESVGFCHAASRLRRLAAC